MTLTFIRSHRNKRSIEILRRSCFVKRSSSSNPTDEWQDFLNRVDAEGSIEPHPVDTSGKPEPWKMLLGYPARAAWRVASSVPPPPFQHALDQVLSGPQRRYSRKVLRKTHEAVLEQQHQLALRRDRERQRILRGNSAVDARLAEKDQGILPVAYGPNETLANLYFRSFPHFTIVQRVLREVQSLLRHQPTPLNIRRVYDFGVGCGSSSAAALHAFPSTIEWIHGIDPSFTMRDVAKCFLQEFAQYTPPPESNDAAAPPRRPPPQMTFSAHAESNPSTVGTFDLSLLTFTAAELPQTAAILAAAGLCWEKLQPNGLFVMVEPGTPDGFSSIRTVRNMLIDCIEDQDSYQIIAPCTHNGRCPLDRYQYREKHKSAAMMPHGEDDEDDEEEEKGKKGVQFSDDGDEEVVESVEKFLADDDDEGDEEGDIDLPFDSYNTGGGGGEEEMEPLDLSEEEEAEGMRKGYCSFVQIMPGGGGRGEKFSYLVVQKRSATTPMVAASTSSWVDVNLTELLQDATARNISNHSQNTNLNEAKEIERRFLQSDEDDLGLELVRNEAIRQSYGRIVRAPKKYRGQVWMDMCVAPGSIVRHQILKRHAVGAPGIYSAARKSRWGGLWPNAANLQEKVK